MIEYRPIERVDLPGVMALVQAEGWPSYVRDAEATWRVLTAAGVCTLVAVDGDQVVGFAQLLTDGQFRAYLSLLLVAPDRRRQGIGRQLVAEAFRHTGVPRIDAITDDAQDFYRVLADAECAGFILHATPRK